MIQVLHNIYTQSKLVKITHNLWGSYSEIKSAYYILSEFVKKEKLLNEIITFPCNNLGLDTSSAVLKPCSNAGLKVA